MIVTYRCLYQQDYCNIESRVKFGMALMENIILAGKKKEE